MKRIPPSLERTARKFSLDAESTEPLSSAEGQEAEAPIWGAFRQKIFSFVRSRSRSPTNRSPGSKSPGSKSPTGFKSPFSVTPTNRSPSSKSPSSRSPANKSPTRRSPSVRSPTSISPKSSPSGTPPLKSPPPSGMACSSIAQASAASAAAAAAVAAAATAAATAAARRNSFSKSSRESRSSSGEAEYLFVTSQRRSSVVAGHSMKKGLGLSLKKESNDSFDSGTGTPGTGSPGTPLGGRRKSKLKGSPSDFLDFQKMDDDLRFAEALLRPRKWSYHGTASPSAPVETPKRHSFSTASDHKSGIVVSNNDLAKLLGQNRLLLPGLPFDMAPLPVLPNPKARGRSQSIAVCAQSIKPLSDKSSKNEPIAPITIRTTDCDHMASLQAHDSMDSQRDEEEDDDPEKLLWDSSGSTVNVNLLGSVIEKYLKTREGDEDIDKDGRTTDEDDENENIRKEIIEDDESIQHEGHPGGLAPPFKRLQVK
ncbi:UNVERIFIED_CONTAM: hypothetical protein RMT77_010437 [Armadillidium vulgare]